LAAGLFFENELLQGLDNTEIERRLAEQALRMLVQRLDELFNYIEPTQNGLSTFGHKTRELLILACTEIENSWKHYMKRANAVPAGRDFTTADYVKIRQPLCLEEYEISLPLYAGIPPSRPFLGWDSGKPTQSIAWYDAYNKTKHDRSSHFEASTLGNCVNAVAAALVMFCVRFGPFHLIHGVNTLTTLSNQMFSFKLIAKPTSFYVPYVILPPNQREDIVCFGAEKLVQPRVVQRLII
jgi:hypothetical protein